jgi:hypothetical protein
VRDRGKIRKAGFGGFFAIVASREDRVTGSRPSAPAARALLGVTSAATPAEVATAFRSHARQVHPDVNPTSDAAARFAALVAAYRVAHQAARRGPDERDDVSAERPDSARGDRRVHPVRTVSTGPAGTAIWEAGQPVLLISGVRTHRPTPRRDG